MRLGLGVIFFSRIVILVYLQGDGNIRYFEVTTEKPYLQYLMEFRSPAPQKGLGKSSVYLQILVISPTESRQRERETLTMDSC